MRLAITAFGLFFVAFLFHLLWWKIRLPRRQLPTLFRWLVVFLPLGLCGLNLIGLWPSSWLLSPASALVALIYLSLTITYVITYSALEGDSPTLSLMRWIASHPNGVSESELDGFMASRPFIQARLKALDDDGLTELRGERVFIKGRPSLFFRIVLGWRSLYGPMEKGG
jgi:hypothetical protein